MEGIDKNKIEKEIHNEPNAENPFTLLDLKLTHVESKAAGVPAVLAAFSDLFEEKTPVRGMRALFKMNQMGGFDCPSCAWPDPDDERSALGEYCENGAKALAEEATTKTVTPEFFKQNSLYDLAKLDDYQIGKMGRLTDPMYLPKGGTHYEPISWDNAFKKIAEHLNALESPDEAAFILQGEPVMKLHLYTSYLQKSSEPIICPIVPICAMKLPDLHYVLL